MSGESGSGQLLRPVPLQELAAQSEPLQWTVEQHLEELESLTPVRGTLSARHRGNALELEGHASTIVTLCCDRCLQHFNHPLSFQTRELLWLGEQARSEGLSAEAMLEPGRDLLDPDLDPDGLTESLDPRGSFDPEHWLFEQLSLQLPLVNRCGSDCPGPDLQTSAEAPRKGGSTSQEDVIDPRWAVLKTLQPEP